MTVSCRAAAAKFRDEPVNQCDQFDRLQLGPRRTGEKHHVGDHLVGPHGLGGDQGQRAAPFGIGFLFEQQLCPAGNDGQGVVDFVPRAGGKLGQRGELLAFERLVEPRLELIEPRRVVCSHRQPRFEGHAAQASGLSSVVAQASSL